ncbi:type II secretion system F family protein [Aequitasia blattaphilus]|uniref:Type II secretion system F family protein n=1 Tax=Aequitasia blattaphilus TaxID=2949332 RepID=A0ABT1EC76_9FIRM|nr:type II secretion system F family protein [Aequitasia blattaphilus]MCP1102441.1 type II secretion system F family protein [Aequitasia blattaphilus]MCR8615081.1 type II secretion system F family protein [Aequitasia blattaphilus]
MTKETEECLRKKKNAFNEQFKNAVAAIASGLSVGNSVENAVVSGEKELRLIYDSKERIIREFQIMIRQLKLHVSMEKIFEDLALRVPEEDVRDFVTVFVTVKKSGGNLVAIIADTARQISEKQEVEREIEILLAAKKYEFKIMTMVPFLIIGYMSLSFPEFMKPLYGNIFGVGVMTICLGIYTVAYYMGLKIIKIEV